MVVVKTKHPKPTAESPVTKNDRVFHLMLWKLLAHAS